MASPSFNLNSLTGVGVGAIGAPGARVFYLQARTEHEVISFRVEKAQIAQLATWLIGELAELPGLDEPPPAALLHEPVEPVWTVGPLGVAYDGESDRFVIEANEMLLEDGDEDPAVARLTLTRPQAAALAVNGIAAVSAGRPPCPLCGQPLDPEGHACPRMNGHRPTG